MAASQANERLGLELDHGLRESGTSRLDLLEQDVNGIAQTRVGILMLKPPSCKEISAMPWCLTASGRWLEVGP